MEFALGVLCYPYGRSVPRLARNPVISGLLSFILRAVLCAFNFAPATPLYPARAAITSYSNLQYLRESCARQGCHIHAYIFMSYHLDECNDLDYIIINSGNFMTDDIVLKLDDDESGIESVSYLNGPDH